MIGSRLAGCFIWIKFCALSWLGAVPCGVCAQEPWEKVKEEMTKEKGLDEAAADRIGDFVKRSGMPPSLSGAWVQWCKHMRGGPVKSGRRA
jgi:hypothetical protein